ncbi:MAG: hydrogenase-4 component G [Desulfobulbaceae bacterium]|nr:hydrogenase-4 component G [Desulfobulbaceae bacterium]MCK5437075.1 hydrogenase-4 component G [Desulfobulbaceae bacterium]MCK5543618.1 hydrogenase-4 component G [Desulfobulbaceae bacterium]
MEIGTCAVAYREVRESSLFYSNSSVESGRSDAIIEEFKFQESRLIEFRTEVTLKSRVDFDKQAGVEQFFELDGFDFSKLRHNNKLISELTREEATELVSENGYFGVNKTSRRLAEFVLKGAGDDLEKLKKGREGIVRGFQEAEKLWGGQLPDISYKTLDKALSMIDDRIRELGGTPVDLTV